MAAIIGWVVTCAIFAFMLFLLYLVGEWIWRRTRPQSHFARHSQRRTRPRMGDDTAEIMMMEEDQ
jgi:hypothetical protein